MLLPRDEAEAVPQLRQLSDSERDTLERILHSEKKNVEGGGTKETDKCSLKDAAEIISDRLGIHIDYSLLGGWTLEVNYVVGVRGTAAPGSPEEAWRSPSGQEELAIRRQLRESDESEELLLHGARSTEEYKKLLEAAQKAAVGRDGEKIAFRVELFPQVVEAQQFRSEATVKCDAWRPAGAKLYEDGNLVHLDPAAKAVLRTEARKVLQSKDNGSKFRVDVQISSDRYGESAERAALWLRARDRLVQRSAGASEEELKEAYKRLMEGQAEGDYEKQAEVEKMFAKFVFEIAADDDESGGLREAAVSQIVEELQSLIAVIREDRVAPCARRGNALLTIDEVMIALQRVKTGVPGPSSRPPQQVIVEIEKFVKEVGPSSQGYARSEATSVTTRPTFEGRAARLALASYQTGTLSREAEQSNDPRADWRTLLTELQQKYNTPRLRHLRSWLYKAAETDSD
jgi:hypothetical protein